ncbi:PEP-CTERM sorting domain-containing protein, partial [Tautonia marina]|uniref:PEP-CTERM sorting domain-containing protein n=1 Tax=Tautonia marina TaxID=2653855 RepID=UPI001F39B2BD
SGQTGGNRNGVLAQSISESDSASKRPSGYSSTFYDTQGRKYDLQAGTVTLAIDLFVPSSSTGRLAGLWATAFDSNNVVSKYPIIEFAKTTSASNGTFRIWKDTAWEEVGGFTNENQWYRIGFSLVGNSLQYYVNNSLVFTDTSVNGSLGFGNVILQGHNAGSNYTIYWDNLSASAVAVPEPSTLVGGTMAAMLGLGLVWRRRRASAI